MNLILLSEALQIMDRPQPFSIQFVMCDEKRKTGGDVIKLESVILSTNEKKMKGHSSFISDAPKTNHGKDPNHYENATRNILLPNGLRKKFHIRLMLYINGLKVYY